MTTTYNRITNKFNYTRTYPQTTYYYNMYIKPYNSSNFLGLLNNIFWWKKSDTLIPILLFVDIFSRKAWAYVLTKSKKEKTGEVSVKTIQEFKDEVGLKKLCLL